MKSNIEARLRKIEVQAPDKPQPVLRVVTRDREECERMAADNPSALVICRLIVDPPNYDRVSP